MMPAPIAALLLACTATPPQVPAERETQVIAASLPVHHLALRLGAGQPWALQLLPPPDADPGTWRPAPDDIARAQGADLLLMNGAGYEAWAATAALPATGVVRTAAAVPPLRRAARTHAHGATGAHAHGDLDPHTWTDPRAYAQQAAAAHAALRALPGADTGSLDAALTSLEADLADLESALVAARPDPGWDLASNHPAFGHLARRLGVGIVDLDLDPATPAGPDALAAVQSWVAGARHPVLLWEAPPAPEVLAGLPGGIRHVVLDPLEHPPSGGDYDPLSQARTNARTLGTLGPPPPP